MREVIRRLEEGMFPMAVATLEGVKTELDALFQQMTTAHRSIYSMDLAGTLPHEVALDAMRALDAAKKQVTEVTSTIIAQQRKQQKSAARAEQAPKALSPDEIKARIGQIVRQAEQETGHAFSGGRGLSMFLTIYVDVGKRRMKFTDYGNGVDEEDLVRRFRKDLPGFSSLQTNLD